MNRELVEKASMMLLEHLANVVQNMEEGPKKEKLQARVGRFRSRWADDPTTMPLYKSIAAESKVTEAVN